MPTGIYSRKPMSRETREKIRLAAIRQHKDGRHKLRKAGEWKPTAEAVRKMSETKKNSPFTPRGETHYLWQKGKISYGGIHSWIRKKLGNAKLFKCSCGAPAKHWSNVDHKYKRNVKDFVPMCVPCHTKYDDKLFKRWTSKRRILAKVRAKKQFSSRTIDSSGQFS